MLKYAGLAPCYGQYGYRAQVPQHLIETYAQNTLKLFREKYYNLFHIICV